jgi:hypothetical protein
MINIILKIIDVLIEIVKIFLLSDIGIGLCLIGLVILYDKSKDWLKKREEEKFEEMRHNIIYGE